MLFIKIAVAYLVLMMKKIINDVIVVEGNSDIAYLSSYIKAIYVATRGNQIPQKEIDFLNHLPKDKRILVLTDSDEAGQYIRERLNKLFIKCENIYVDISKCHKNGKHGVAECEIEEILTKLNPYFSTYEIKDNIKPCDLVELGLNNKEKRDYICQKLHLGICNNKTLIKRINYLQIPIKIIKEVMLDYGN